MGGRVAFTQPPVRRSRKDGRPSLWSRRARDRRRPWTGQLLRAPGVDGKVIPRAITLTAVLLATLALATCVEPPRASASVGGAACTVAGAANGVAGKACNLLRAPGKVVSAGKKLLTGHVGS